MYPSPDSEIHPVRSQNIYSWLIESAGTVPIKRKEDFPDGQVDHSHVMEKLMGSVSRYVIFPCNYVDGLV